MYGPRITRAATPTTLTTSSSGIAVKMTLPGRVRRAQARETVVIRCAHEAASPHLSTPPMTGSRLAMTAIVSATRLPGISRPTLWR